MTRTQERAALYARAEALKQLDGSFSDREEFDRLMDAIDKIDAETPPASTPPATSRTVTESIMNDQQRSIFTRAERLGYPGVFYGGSCYLRGQEQWSLVFEHGGRVLMPADLAEIERELDRIERHQAALQRQAIPAVPASDPAAYDPFEEMARAANEGAARAAEHAATPEARTERLIASNERLADALERQAGR